MKTATRKVIDTVGAQIDDMGWPRDENHWGGWRLMGAKDLRAIAKTIEQIATFWEKHPDRWTIGTEVTYESNILTGETDTWGNPMYKELDKPKFCNIGMLTVVNGNVTEYKVTGWAFRSDRPVSFLTVHGDWIIELNDATPLEGNIEGLRTSAKVFRLAAEVSRKDRSDESWSKAVRKAFAHNAHLLQVQTARKAARVLA